MGSVNLKLKSSFERPVILSKELDRELSKIYLYKEFSNEVNFTPVVVGHTKLMFFSFFNFFLKNKPTEWIQIFTDYIAIYILHYHD